MHRRTFVATAVAVVLAFAARTAIAKPPPASTVEPGALATQHPLYGLHGRHLAYQLYEGTYYELGYTYESTAWPTGGARDVRLSGLSFLEQRGLLLNFVTAVAALMGAPSSTHVVRNGRVEWDPAAASVFYDKYVDGVIGGAEQLPFSLDLRLFHDALGSEMNGLSGELGGGGHSFLSGGKFVLFWKVNLAGGWLWSNRLGAPVPERPQPGEPEPGPVTEYERRWLGLSADTRLTFPSATYLTLRARFSAAFASYGALLLLEAGPEFALGNRFQLRTFATKDFGTGAPLGLRADLGVRF